MSALTTVLELLGKLDTDYVLYNTFRSQPVLPAGKVGVMPYRTNVIPAPTAATQYTWQHTFTIHLISPVQDPEDAIPHLEPALDEVVALLDTDQQMNWTDASWGRFNDNLWCWTVTLTVLTQHIPTNERH